LHFIRHNYRDAKNYYKRALEADSNNKMNLTNYAVFLWKIQKDYESAEEYLIRALEADPNNDIIMCNYGIFLENIRKDYTVAEDYYKRALEVEPNNIDNLRNYANFLKNIRKDYRGADEYYKLAIEADPNNFNNLGSYANFLKNLCHDYEAAKKYYQRALEADSDNSNNLGNYAGFLLGKGDPEGFTFLEKALEKADRDDLIIECLFYQYAHDPDPQNKQKSLDRIRESIRSGVRSPGWNLEANVARAIQDGHPEPRFLESLAKVITDEMNEQELEKFTVWKNSK
jgi:tetratricopeptide (TPR) repeat protein